MTLTQTSVDSVVSFGDTSKNTLYVYIFRLFVVKKASIVAYAKDKPIIYFSFAIRVHGLVSFTIHLPPWFVKMVLA